jgi:AraC-like DNA-binding protein
MHRLADLITHTPILPYIRQSDYAVRKPWYSYERRLLDYLFIYVQEGSCVFHADGTDYSFEAGEFCLLQPNTLHTLKGVTNTITPFVHMDIFYNPLRIDSFPTKSGQTDLSHYAHLMQPRLNDLNDIEVPVKLKPSNAFRFGDTFLRMVELWNRRTTFSQLEAHNLANELVLAILKDHTSVQAATVPSDTSLQWMTSYLYFHLTSPITIEQMAERANLSPSRFRAVFKEQFGLPPHQYLRNLRLRHSQDLLQSTGHTLEEIAAYCGFADVHHFAKAFKKEIGISPGMYRKEHQERSLQLR